LIGAESAGLPLPGEAALIAAALLAHSGELRIELVIPIAAAAAIVGDNIGYMIGRRGARTLLLLPGPFKGRREAFLVQGEPFFERHGPKAVFLGRWTAVLRIAVAWLAGAHRMRWSTFSFWNALGAIAWASVVGLLAYLLGPVVERFFAVFGVASAIAGVAILLALFSWRRRATGATADRGNR
jgi:membrane protein DedA with SNARE-associated domain